jgi:hypothetical protein
MSIHSIAHSSEVSTRSLQQAKSTRSLQQASFLPMTSLILSRDIDNLKRIVKDGKLSGKIFAAGEITSLSLQAAVTKTTADLAFARCDTYREELNLQIAVSTNRPMITIAPTNDLLILDNLTVTSLFPNHLVSIGNDWQGQNTPPGLFQSPFVAGLDKCLADVVAVKVSNVGVPDEHWPDAPTSALPTPTRQSGTTILVPKFLTVDWVIACHLMDKPTIHEAYRRLFLIFRSAEARREAQGLFDFSCC